MPNRRGELPSLHGELRRALREMLAAGQTPSSGEQSRLSERFGVTRQRVSQVLRDEKARLERAQSANGPDHTAGQ